jgi:hypothetical protein
MLYVVLGCTGFGLSDVRVHSCGMVVPGLGGAPGFGFTCNHGVPRIYICRGFCPLLQGAHLSIVWEFEF